MRKITTQEVYTLRDKGWGNLMACKNELRAAALRDAIQEVEDENLRDILFAIAGAKATPKLNDTQ
jgi:hypothetical protein